MEKLDNESDDSSSKDIVDNVPNVIQIPQRITLASERLQDCEMIAKNEVIEDGDLVFLHYK